MPNINFTPFPNLTTERLTLRQLSVQDENELFTLRADEEAAKFVDRPVVQSVEGMRQFIDRINDGVAKNEWIFWAITFKNDPKLIGTICLWNMSVEDEKAEIGYELIRVYQGKGIMQESVTAVIEYGFKQMGLKAIEGVVHPDNVKSIKLLERNKFIRDNTFAKNEGM